MAKPDSNAKDQAELQKLLNELQDFACSLVDKAGGFPPIGGTVDIAGQVGLVVEGTPVATKSGQEQLNKVLDALRQEAAPPTIQAAGLTYMATVGGNPAARTPAVISSLHHRSGMLVDVILPYSRDAKGKVTFGEQSIQDGSLRILAP